MKKLLAILNSKYFLTAVIGISILVIILGVLMVKHANEQVVVYAEKQRLLEQNKQQTAEQDALKQFELVAAQAAAELKATTSGESGPPARIDLIPESSKQKVANMKNKNPSVGSDDWCELMMVKPDVDWTKEEQGIFAKNCL